MTVSSFAAPEGCVEMIVAAIATAPSKMNQNVKGRLRDGSLCRRKVSITHPLMSLHRRRQSLGRSGLERAGCGFLHRIRKKLFKALNTTDTNRCHSKSGRT